MNETGLSRQGTPLGRLLDQNWDWYFYFMVPFGLIGGVLMLTILGKVTASAPVAETAKNG